jgi:hypothetical protein
MVGHRIEIRKAEMTGRQVELAECGTPIQSSSARFRVGGIGRGQGIVLLYPDKLAAVNSYTELWGILLGSIVFGAISSSLFHDTQGLGSVVGVLAGGWIGQGIGKWLAARRATANRDGVRLIPLDQIASVQFRKSTGFRAWLIGQTLLVTTTDGTVHQFRGRLDGWQAALAGVLTVSGRDVHVTPQGITVTPELGEQT